MITPDGGLPRRPDSYVGLLDHPVSKIRRILLSAGFGASGDEHFRGALRFRSRFWGMVLPASEKHGVSRTVPLPSR